MKDISQDVFRKSGRAWAGIVMFFMYGGLILGISLMMTAEQFTSGADTAGIVFTVIFWVFAIVILYGGFQASQKKVVEIDGSRFRYYSGSKLKKDIPLRSIKTVRTYRITGKAPASGIIIEVKEEKALCLNNRDSLGRDLLKSVFTQLCNFSNIYGYTVEDRLHWGNVSERYNVKPSFAPIESSSVQ